MKFCALLAVSLIIQAVPLMADGGASMPTFRKEIEPILQEYCYDCHGDGMKKGGLALDQFASDEALISNHAHWEKVLKMVRTELMPPNDKSQPTEEERALLAKWIKREVFKSDPTNPDPGRVTVRRLNRVEYRNTIRDLIDVDFNTGAEFPADDSGHGFDNIADVLTVSPMLMEKYFDAAKKIVDEAVPMVSRVIAKRVIPGNAFVKPLLVVTEQEENGDRGRSRRRGDENSLNLSYYEPALAKAKIDVKAAGTYQLVLNLRANERYVENQFDHNKAAVEFSIDGESVLKREFVREGGKRFPFTFERKWKAGEHLLDLEVKPLTPDEEQVRSLSLRIESVTLIGPLEEEHWVHPNDYERFFPREVPEHPTNRQAYARELLADFALKAYRRSVDPSVIDRLVALARQIYSQPDKTFEAGIAQAMTAVLVSPQFLFREESIQLGSAEAFPDVDEYALASRLSYFFWSSMPDAELIRLAGENKLRANLKAQVERLLADDRSKALMRNFPGQWLQARDIEGVNISERDVLRREQKRDPKVEALRDRFRELRRIDADDLTEAQTKELADVREEFYKSFRNRRRVDFGGRLRRAMRQETEMHFEYLVREDRSLVELLDADYAFLNEDLAKHYGVEGVDGREMQRVSLPADSPRGGILTQGTMLGVTSNPDRTSPVKRGVFILENLLGTPPAPPPANIPSLEDAVDESRAREVTVRESLAIHRAEPLCASCHNRMDPLGLALENFNAMGMWRDHERDKPISAQGRLITGESFDSVKALKRILATERREDFYHCVTEKMLTYALGRGLEYYDVETIDQIVERLKAADGRPSALIMGIVESAPFQKRRKH